MTGPAPAGGPVLRALVEDPHASRARHRTVRRDGTGLAVVEVGPPDAPAWLVAHGVGSSARFVAAALADPILAAGGRLVAYDLRGHGASDAARTVAEHHLDVHAADLAAVAVSTTGPLAVVGGISLGGHAAVRATPAIHRQTAGVRSGDGQLGASLVTLACLPAWTGHEPPGTGPHAVIAAQAAAVGIDGLLAGLRGDGGLARWLRHTLVVDYARHDADSLLAALASLDGGDAPDEHELAALPTPLAVVGWPDDPGHPLAVAQWWAELAPVAHLETIAIEDLEVRLTRFGEAVVAAVDRLGVRT